ncbi:hypothetical protein THAOC_17962 [Thalassiosira oceanica]|uniref:Uncharacterized protein n=1 Tax=Thalassiosira oceanica TaxID=159749 RepID=K0S5Y9_THAOC|nr:hypothetical protein THAOC_17962 [Thalassiosira oceanica]|eukprot:EJK61533.1 hypothetical protein THAOC_17962 [Thalassiosira oceanica]
MPLRAKWIALASVCVLSFWNTILQVPSLPLGDHSNSFDHAPPAVTSVSAAADEQLHIALALAGREPGVFDEFEAALKSDSGDILGDSQPSGDTCLRCPAPHQVSRGADARNISAEFS